MSKRNKQEDQTEADLGKAAKNQAGELSSIANQDTSETEEKDGSLIHVPLDTVPVNVTLPCTFYTKKAGKTLVFRRQGEKITYKTALEMQRRDSNSLYIHTAFWEMFTKSLANLHGAEQNLNAEAKAVHMRQLLLAYGQELDKRLREPKKPLFDQLRKLSEGISQSVQSNPALASKLLRTSENVLENFVNHSVNTAIYATLIALKQKLRPEDIKKLTYATIVHDIGNLYLPKRILYKHSELTEDELDVVKTHTRRGAELLHSLQAPTEVVKAVLQHHERIDGTGYPKGLSGDDIHIFAKIIAVADTFDALTSNRPHRQGISTTEALKEMSKMNGAFDPKLISIIGTSAEEVQAKAVETVAKAA